MILNVLILGIAIDTCLAGKSGIIRPCHLSDKKCIADNLKANSRCNPRVAGVMANKYTLRNMRFEAPFFNASFVDNSLIVRNHDKCKVSEFYFNMATDTAVLSVDCPHIDFESDRTLIQHTSKKEDSKYNYHIRGEYPMVRLTTNLRHAEKLDLCSAFVFADVTALPNFKVDPLGLVARHLAEYAMNFINAIQSSNALTIERENWLRKLAKKTDEIFLFINQLGKNE